MIRKDTKKNIFDHLNMEGIHFSGRMSDIDFLGRLYTLTDLPSNDGRFDNGYGDIWQHTENNNDYQGNWVFQDSRFELLDGSDERFLNFLCEMIHPLVRTDQNQVEKIVSIANDWLKDEGWEIYSLTMRSGKSIFSSRSSSSHSKAALARAKEFSKEIGSEYISQQTIRMETSIDSDPELAIGTAKEFLETICKTVLDEFATEDVDKLEFQPLVKQTLKVLDLVPEEIDKEVKGSEVVKSILGSLATISHKMAELRNWYGSGHGKIAQAKGLQPRHARLAVGAAISMGIFIYDTYMLKKEIK